MTKQEWLEIWKLSGEEGEQAWQKTQEMHDRGGFVAPQVSNAPIPVVITSLPDVDAVYRPKKARDRSKPRFRPDFSIYNHPDPIPEQEDDGEADAYEEPPIEDVPEDGFSESFSAGFASLKVKVKIFAGAT